MMSARTNAFASGVGRAAGLSAVGGSDAHTLSSVARAWTAVPGARNREEFLEGLRRGLTLPEGSSGTYARLTADVARIFAAAYAEGARRCLDGWIAAARFTAILAVAPILTMIPLATAAIYAHELLFATRHHRLFQSSMTGGAQRSGSLATASAAPFLS